MTMKLRGRWASTEIPCAIPVRCLLIALGACYCYCLLAVSSMLQAVVVNQRGLVTSERSGWNHSISYLYNPEKTTLALLYPQGLLGGYRNQVMRFSAFVAHAKKNNISQLLLPSILWGTTYTAAKDERTFFPVPMDKLFDVDHWNTFHRQLPILVDRVDQSDCWGVNSKRDGTKQRQTEEEGVFVSPMADEVLNHSALLIPVRNVSEGLLLGKLPVNSRKLDVLHLVDNCTNPVVYGGGRGAGRLWNDYLMYSKGRSGQDRAIHGGSQFPNLISLVARALTPAPIWRDLALECIANQQQRGGRVDKALITRRVSPYAALHARVEVDMMVHRCGIHMEKNLSTILSMTDTFLASYSSIGLNQKLNSVFLAVSREGMKQTTKDEGVMKLASMNWKILNERSGPRVGEVQMQNSQTSIFECGERWMDKWYQQQSDVQPDYYGSLVPSIMNFYIATQATVFIGVERSSWSTDVWTARYHQGRGDTNFMYTADGIIPVPNKGIPLTHKNC